jgi:small GTP-binding protein
MIRKKICMLGTSAVGKTSLVERFTTGIFSDKYLTTVGVKISKKEIFIDRTPLELLLWDLNGEDRFQRLSSKYLRGMAGYFLVIDGTRTETVAPALSLCDMALREVGSVPFIILLNKSDLEDDWELEEPVLAEIRATNPSIISTSAKSGMGVDEAFQTLARRMISRPQSSPPT